jgi:hypothetical protein
MLNIRHLYGRLVPSTLSWSFCVKTEVKLAGLLLRVVPLVFGQLSASLVKVVWGYAKNVRRILRGSGTRGLAVYLKACYLVTQQVAGGQVVDSPWALGGNVARTRKGLPRIINPQHRTLILKGDISILRLWLTLFGLYRVVEFKGALKLKTITQPGVDLSAFMGRWEAWVPCFYARARLITAAEWKLDPTRALTIRSIPFIRKSSPNSQGLSALVALPLDLLLWSSDRAHSLALVRWLKLIDEVDFLWAWQGVRKCLLRLAQLHFRSASREELVRNLPHIRGCEGPLTEEDYLLAYQMARIGPLRFGKLGFKEEPGKIRVFAMMNLVTQTLMQPLHSWIFRHLRLIPNDGTFDQVKPVNRLLKRIGTERFWIASYDLSAATDRLPLALQISLLRPLLGDELTDLWSYFMVGHPYELPRVAKSYNLGFSMVWYAVGQPMGALSSWAMLALTHHAIVQYAATLAHPYRTSWFLRYAVLGDDVVIADKSVATKYLEVMKEIGVDISLAKSMVSASGSLEFAKRTWISGREASPIPLAELVVALCHLGALEQLVRKCSAYVTLRMSSVARFAGFGYRNLAQLPVAFSVGNRQGRLLSYLTRPGGIWPMPVEAWLSAVGPGRESRLRDHRVWATAQALWERLASSILARAWRFTRTLYVASECQYVDITVKRRERQVGTCGSGADQDTGMPGATAAAGRRSPWGSQMAKTLGLDVHRDVWTEFFTTWVAYPFTSRLRKVLERADERLQVLQPKRQPQWDRLDELWAEIFETEESISALPSRIDYLDRETDEVAPSSRLITLWTKLRSIGARGAVPPVDLTDRLVEEAPPRRRRPLV